MKGLIFHGKRDIRYESLNDPGLEDDRDALVRAVACGICGSDLHLYHDDFAEIGEGFELGKGFCVGHEAVGEVVETGKGVANLKVGDTVMLAAMTGCGNCRPCLRGESKQCENGGWNVYGFGIGLGGCQAELIRVPAADYNAARLPEGVTVDQGILLTDNLSTAYGAALGAEIRPGRSVAVIGLGPIGLMAVELAMVMGASVVYAIDPVAERRQCAAEMGAVPVWADDVAAHLREETQGRMVDCIIEAVGGDRTMEAALSLVGVNGNISILGVNNSMNFRIPRQVFVNNATIRGNFVTEVHKHWPALVPMLQSGRLRPERFITERMPLSEGPEGYRKFDEREGGTLKAILYT
ncbi:alcohol dehydrogenase catalytic domain-containing protein [Tsuneonella sp. CC-YZS046]|uniref:alcohol dehydrogenase catalytic domain-containing protein n=1 Tax=Tsuneonella sp. CC-YZS046 TaxID=3042152 RepID=UPI002D78C3A8|nr:alcohol dehydrogenase catalytic domain-containing protein [Tsuneonella sp. CC-YZS046]WRO65886.1 alcohol dehydrogenase catalytic domain-containing protein [Tsuneonella sp. CC-YZS046]